VPPAAESSSPEPVTAPSTAKGKPKPWFWIAVVLAFVTVFSVRMLLAKRLSAPPVLVELPAFTLTNEQGQTFGAANLRGKPYIANFVFTSCPSVCPRLTKRMAEVQERTGDLGDALRLVTFTVDPETDTPEVLRTYAQKYGADPKRWSFLTGKLDEIEPVIVKGFKMMRDKKETSPGMFEIVHGERFVLVDGKGLVRGFYEATNEGLDALLRDARNIVSD
jgi:protein SCO1/2